MTPEIVMRHSNPVPRYTSYPTATHFSSDIGPLEYGDWLGEIPSRAKLSLYVHIPFCERLCWYCGCSTKAVNKYDPVKAYVGLLREEMSAVGALIPDDHKVTHIHWGGGTPNILRPADILSVAATIRRAFCVADDAEFAVEIDPRGIDACNVAAFAIAGVNRVSIGVQDFDVSVQEAINRQQSFETTKCAVDLFRAEGIGSVNVDLVYGLPHQTRTSVTRTIEQVLTLRPERIAVFGYAHIPSRMRHQVVIDEASLPDVVERFAQSQRIARLLKVAGYESVGLDHYALPSDRLAQGHVQRNFQGYTTDDADALIGLGASAIGRLPRGYVQNAVSAGEYGALIRERGLATKKGLALSDDDRLRAHVIETLMCRFEFSASELRQRFGAAAEAIISEANEVIDSDREGFIERTADGFCVTPLGRPFVRAVCACFDAHLGSKPAQHALAV